MSETSTNGIRGEPLRAFSAAMVELRRQADNPSEQSLAKHMNCGRSSVSEFLTGRRFPSWKLTKGFVAACGGALDEWRDRWLATDRALSRSRSADPGGTGPGGGVGTRDLGVRPREEPALPVSDDRDEEEVFRATRYANHRRFYAAATRQVHDTDSQIRLVYVRQYPPSQYTSVEAADYFSAVVEWARRPGVSVRRIIGVPVRAGVPNTLIVDWLRENDRIATEVLNFEARIFEWDAQADGLSLAIFDESPVFLAFSGRARQNLYGRSVADVDFVRDYVDYFEQLWPGIRPAADYLADRVGGAAGTDRGGG